MGLRKVTELFRNARSQHEEVRDECDNLATETASFCNSSCPYDPPSFGRGYRLPWAFPYTLPVRTNCGWRAVFRSGVVQR